MEELIAAIHQIYESLAQKSLPVWVSYASALGPLILTIITAIIALLQYKNNVHLQKQLHNREIIVQSRNSILCIYDTCCIAQGLANTAMISNGVFTVFENIADYNKKIFDNYYPMVRAMNQARLFFEKDDKQLYEVLKNVGEKYFAFHNAVAAFITSGEANKALNAAWNNISQCYHIPGGNYMMLHANETAYKQFYQLCETDKVKEIKEKAKQFLDLLPYESFDCNFEKYLQISEIE